MPFITCKVNRPISREQETALKSRMGKAIERVPGKSEAYLLLNFEPDSPLWLRGENSEPIAYIQAAIFGNEGHHGYREFTVEITRAFGEILGIPAENVYIKYEDIAAWGVNGQYIDRGWYQ